MDIYPFEILLQTYLNKEAQRKQYNKLIKLLLVPRITLQPLEKRLLLADQESSVSIQINNKNNFSLSVFCFDCWYELRLIFKFDTAILARVICAITLELILEWQIIQHKQIYYK